MNSNHEPLIAWFLRELDKVVKQPNFRAWNEKHQVACPWLTRARMAYFHLVFALLGDISACCTNQDILENGNNLPSEKHELVM